MPEIEFSVMVHTPQTKQVLRTLLDEFEAQSGVRVNLHTYPWASAHAELNKTALYHHGPDVSEIGSTWVPDLIAMNALRPFSRAEVAQIGRAEEFIAGSWKSCQMIGDPTQWAMPWLAETYVLHYRRDLLAQAGVDEASAFSSHLALAQTVDVLYNCGVQIPFELTLLQDAFGMLHSLASWVWSAGGAFSAEDGKRVLFNRPEAVEAIRAYFSLQRRLSAQARQKLRERNVMLFDQGGSAMTYGTLMFYDNHKFAPQLVQDNWAVTPLPGQHFMGGSNLVVWKHCHNDQAALELVRYLTGPEINQRCALALNALPPRVDAFASPAISEHPIYRVFAESIHTGRSYDPVPLWGLIEDRLVGTLVQLGMAAVAEEPVDLDALTTRAIESLARKLNVTLAQ